MGKVQEKLKRKAEAAKAEDAEESYPPADEVEPVEEGDNNVPESTVGAATVHREGEEEEEEEPIKERVDDSGKQGLSEQEKLEGGE